MIQEEKDRIVGISVSINVGLLEELDSYRKKVELSRSEFIKQAITEKLDRDKCYEEVK